MKMITRETVRRALRTFIQAVVAYIMVHIAVIDWTSSEEVLKETIIGLIVSAIASGISALMNLESED